uniref:Ribosomal protein S18 acetylase RimI n=1 Tax=uncultured Thiotrichaceae bacterium TaxID=298394 RepID=A0A6S6SA73_9GAMM|nr:MAG: Ribosomal protein S18 acetylase RimI [uncultured Thiotrichaceae bacterium]
MEINLRKLDSKDDRSHFSSGDIELDRFFQRYAGQNQFRHYVGITYITEYKGSITGFVTVSSGEITIDRLDGKLRKRLPDYPLPVLRIARLAVDQNFQGYGIGKHLLRSMLKLALQMRDQAWCVGIVVDAKPDAIGFYRSLGFEALDLISGELGDRPEPTPMFLPIKVVAKLV